MIFLPIEHIIYKTNLKEDEVIKRLSSLIKPEKAPESGIFGNIWLNEYKGEIIGRTFNIKRNKVTRENFLPRISGCITNDFDGTSIEVKMKLNKLITVFLYVWGAAYGIAFLFYTVKSVNDLEIDVWSPISLVMLLFAYTSAMIGFKYESIRSKKDLALVFDADIIDR